MVKGTLAYSVRLNGQGRLLSRLYADLQVIDQLHYRDHRIHSIFLHRVHRKGNPVRRTFYQTKSSVKIHPFIIQIKLGPHVVDQHILFPLKNISINYIFAI